MRYIRASRASGGSGKGGSEASRAKRVRCALRKPTEAVPRRPEGSETEGKGESPLLYGRRGSAAVVLRGRARIRVRVNARI